MTRFSRAGQDVLNPECKHDLMLHATCYMLVLFSACFKQKGPEQRHDTEFMYLFDILCLFVRVLDELTETNSVKSHKFKTLRSFIHVPQKTVF